MPRMFPILFIAVIKQSHGEDKHWSARFSERVQPMLKTCSYDNGHLDSALLGKPSGLAVSSRPIPTSQVVGVAPCAFPNRVVRPVLNVRVFAKSENQVLQKAPNQQEVKPPHPATIDPDVLLRDCEFKQTRGSGPGGQHRNKVATAIQVRHLPTDVMGSASETRSQVTNKKNAIFRLRVKMALALRTMAIQGNVTDEPSPLWRQRVKSGKVSVSDSHEDFPAILSEALDYIWASQDVKAASEALGVSTSQLVKLLGKEPAALQLVNNMRRSKGLPALRGNK
eukprot:gnl/MRDRNA2_/MRDRNA2_103073_c0_seq1.p1 gnl/MRDRNA2_/MRDRNA2_103073_c0~~gnl/MRDRNA2_/MRDRNA2_103073_c0_seq1.p1  ORF type:complete len:281 (-),score=41.73 gnl/MRDRNA2_/MRDRNA2_103073_c0_seq1:134-976(-)